MKFYQRKWFWAIFILVFSVVLARHFKVDIHDEGFGRGWYYGDAHSEKNVESASRYYLEHGFTKNSGLPVYEYNDDNPANDYVYSHYPPLSEWLGGLWANILQEYDAVYIGLFPLLLSVLLFFLIYKILGEFLQEPRAAFIGASLLVLSNYFICWADDIHQHLYIELLKWLFVYGWWMYLKTEKKNLLIYFLLCLSYFAMCLLSYETYVYTAIIVVGFSFVIRKQVFRLDVFVLLLVPVLAFSLRLYVNYLYFGSWDAMVSDMYNAMLERTVGGGSKQNELGRAMTLHDYIWLLPKTRLHRLGHFYIFPSFVIIGLGILGFLQVKKKSAQLFKIVLVVYLASLSWLFVMPQHALIHIFTLRHIGLFLGLVLGYGILRYKEMIITHYREKKYIYMTLHSVVLGYSFLYAMINTFYFVYLCFGWAYPSFGTHKYELINQFLF